MCERKVAGNEGAEAPEDAGPSSFHAVVRSWNFIFKGVGAIEGC